MIPRNLVAFLSFTAFALSAPHICLAQSSSTSAPAPPATAAMQPDATAPPLQSSPLIYTDASLPIAVRVNDLVSRMSLSEKVSQLMNGAPAIPSLGVPAYNYWSEGLHGIAREGIATVFPQAIAMAATFDPDLVHSMGNVVGTEARAKFNVKGAAADHVGFQGLTIWSPNINIFRDPRWGRGQETYGEDPFLTGTLGVEFIRGLQGDDPKYYLAVACAKHFAVHSGPEPKRHAFNATPPERDLYETYLPQFEMAVKQGHVGQVMSAYNAIDGVPAPANKWLLTDLLRNTWGFDGYVVSDCDAVGDIVDGHHYAPTKAAAAVDALQAGTDLNCGSTYLSLLDAVQGGQITEREIDTALKRVLTVRFKLGLFDPQSYPYARLSIADNDSPQHAALALKAAHESLVLLRNNGILPIDPNKTETILVCGANADDTSMMLGNYNGTPSHSVSILQGLKAAVGSNVNIIFAKGCPLAVAPGDTTESSSPDNVQTLALAKSADVIVYVGGISPKLEGEEMHVNFVGFDGGDRTAVELPAVQENFIESLSATGKPVVYVNCSGSAVAMPWENSHLAAILQAWYPGQSGGTAVADVLFGKCNPSGRLPITFYNATTDLPDFEDYSMANRTYRYFTGTPLFPFGYGLSYTTFQYGTPHFSSLQVSPQTTFHVSLPITNTGGVDGDEVVQVYVKHIKSDVPQPIHSLCGFERITVPKGKNRIATFDINPQQFRYWDVGTKRYVVDPGPYEIQIGASSADIRQKQVVTVAGL